MFSLQSSASVSSHLHLVQEVAALRQKGCARLLHKVLQRLHHILTPGVVILPRFVFSKQHFILFFLIFFNHMTPIKLKGEQRNRHKDLSLLNKGQNVLNQLLWPKKINPITTDVRRCVCSYCGGEEEWRWVPRLSVLWRKQWNLLRIKTKRRRTQRTLSSYRSCRKLGQFTSNAATFKDKFFVFALTRLENEKLKEFFPKCNLEGAVGLGDC